MAATDNLASLHDDEEELRARSLEAIKADAALSDHWNLVAEAMNAIYAFTHDHVHGSEDELTLQYLGIRLFNAAGASVKLALSGGERKRIYDLISELASHASYPGISLTTTGPANMAQVGPFFDEKKLRVWVSEIAMRLSHAALVLSSDPEGRDLKLQTTRMHYHELLKASWSKYRGVKL